MKMQMEKEDRCSFPDSALQQTPFLGTKLSFATDSEEFPRESSKFLRKGWPASPHIR